MTGTISGVNISPTIYSPQNNLAILNEFSSFNFTAYNYSNETWNVIISVIANNDELFSDQFSVPNQSIISKVVHQELCYVGPWLIKAISNETRASTSYAFVTVANIQEADTQIKATENVQNQQNSANLANTISIIALIVSTITGSIAIVISILSYRRKR